MSYLTLFLVRYGLQSHSLELTTRSGAAGDRGQRGRRAGVNTTVSSGMIGGGVLNFGQIFRPVVAGILMALWAGLLIRWWKQRKSLLRLVLFMLGAGLTFDLGRDIGLLVLWPVIFAYFFVRLAERWVVRGSGEVPQLSGIVTADAGPIQAVAGRLSQ